MYTERTGTTLRPANSGSIVAPENPSSKAVSPTKNLIPVAHYAELCKSVKFPALVVANLRDLNFARTVSSLTRNFLNMYHAAYLESIREMAVCTTIHPEEVETINKSFTEILHQLEDLSELLSNINEWIKDFEKRLLSEVGSPSNPSKEQPTTENLSRHR